MSVHGSVPCHGIPVHIRKLFLSTYLLLRILLLRVWVKSGPGILQCQWTRTQRVVEASADKTGSQGLNRWPRIGLTGQAIKLALSWHQAAPAPGHQSSHYIGSAIIPKVSSQNVNKDALAWHGPEDPDIYGTARHGKSWHGKSWHGTARKILARKINGTAWHGKNSIKLMFGEINCWSKNSEIFLKCKSPHLAIIIHI